MPNKPNIIDILEERGLIEAVTDESLREKLAEPRVVYCGFDPTSDSLHVGNLVPIMGLAWFQRCGHTPIAVLGGATGMIGDPGGKTTERPLMEEATIQRNVDGIRKNLELLLDFKNPNCAAKILNNYDWFKDFTLIGFLRDVGRYFRLGSMLSKEAVKARLQSDEGLSFTEFTYQLLQGYDFLYLYDHYGVEVELGGSDQWGNITAGTELVRRLRSVPAYGVTFPLLTRSDGQKFGKSERGAIWLSPEKLSPYEFYQYLVRVADADVLRLMRMITFMDMAEISRYEVQMRESGYVPNTAQKRLALEVTRLIHGEEGLQTALKVTEGITPGSETALDAQLLEKLAGDMPSVALSKADVQDSKLVDLLVKTQMQPSKGQARRLVENGGVYLNNSQISDPELRVASYDILDGRLLLLAVGKKNKLIVRIEG